MFAAGRPVPAMPLDLTADEGGVTVPLDDTYAAAWPEIPAVWRAAGVGCGLLHPPSLLSCKFAYKRPRPAGG